jgi:hypothetical protein
MNTLQKLEQQIQEILKCVELPSLTYGDVDTCAVFYALASQADWGKAELDNIDFFSKRLDISKKFFLGYQGNGRRALDKVLTDKAWLELAVAILFKAVILSQDDLRAEISLKRFNALFKLLDIIKPSWMAKNTELGKAMELAWASLNNILPVAIDELVATSNSVSNNHRSEQDYKVIPLTVLFYEGPIARAYLETIKSLDLKPQKIIELVAAKDVATKKPVGKWLPSSLRKSYAASIQRNKIHYWPKQLLKTNADFINGILSEVQEKLDFTRTILDNASMSLPLSSYSDCVESLLVEGLGDKELQRYLSNETAGTVLFTGGGIMSATLLDIPQLCYLHIHPGFLPNIRGADCALWSSLLTGHVSATCFYMTPGIDTGDIIKSCWLPNLFFSVNAQGIDIQSVYRAIYGFLDPWIRSYVLREVLYSNASFENIESIAQSEDQSVTYHFMHEKLRIETFNKMFSQFET